MNTHNSIANFTIHEFKEKIKSVEDFPTLEEFIKWVDKHRMFAVSAFNHLVYIMQPQKQPFELSQIKKEHRN